MRITCDCKESSSFLPSRNRDSAMDSVNLESFTAQQWDAITAQVSCNLASAEAALPSQQETFSVLSAADRTTNTVSLEVCMHSAPSPSTSPNDLTPFTRKRGQQAPSGRRRDRLGDWDADLDGLELAGFGSMISDTVHSGIFSLQSSASQQVVVVEEVLREAIEDVTRMMGAVAEMKLSDSDGHHVGDRSAGMRGVLGR